MAKPKVLRIYETNPVLPRDWGFPMLIVVTKTLGKLGVAVAQPITRKGEADGPTLQLEIQLIEKRYHLLHIREARKVLEHKDGWVVLELIPEKVDTSGTDAV